MGVGIEIKHFKIFKEGIYFLRSKRNVERNTNIDVKFFDK
ncbi:hypothetical protein HJ01_03566 [Flavobacterium frigoris PS1]|uniref:Uncharacterized protein n=1 Tax=Flavobacterium frigoris (strain PS1) TaxID=1086011 RepID=H7FWM2_FLAFP|nr:hypothetical protein HJ01_03566 [Flavobacterium frigoris PS1]